VSAVDKLPLSWKVAVARGLRVVESAEPSSRIRLHTMSAGSPPTALLCIYRRDNAPNVERLVASGPPDTVVRLWALDETAPRLAQWTIGSGPGLRVPLLNRCWLALPDGFDGYVVHADDDVELTRGSLQDALSLGAHARLDIAQPAHDGRSRSSHVINAARPFTLARLTTFVEIGPIVILSPRASALTMPMPTRYGMGPGLEVEWMATAHRGLRLGVLDAVTMRHLGEPGAAYDLDSSLVDFRAAMVEMGGYENAVRTLESWRVWQRAAPWSS
jgi:hypothetical protein